MKFVNILVKKLIQLYTVKSYLKKKINLRQILKLNKEGTRFI